MEGLKTCGIGKQELVRRNIILVGEAGGLQDPIAGFGMTPALLSATIASRVIKKVLLDSDINLLMEYQKIVRNEIIRHGIRKNWNLRTLVLESLTNEDLEALIAVIRDDSTIFEYAFKTGQYSKVIRSLTMKAVRKRPELLLIPFRYLFRKIFGEAKLPKV